MKKFLVLATVLMGVLMTVVPAHAGDSTRTIADIREEFNGLIVQLNTIDNVCVTILSGLLSELQISILEGRKLVTVGKGNLNTLLLDLGNDAVATIEKLGNTLDQCLNEDDGLVTTFGEELSSLKTEIEGLRQSNEGTLDNRKATKIDALLTNASSRVSSIETELGDIGDGLDNLSKDVLDPVFSILEGSSASTLTQVAPQLTETGPISFGNLREIKILLGEGAASVKSLLRLVREVTREKKWVFKAVRETQELLRNTGFGGHGTNELTGANLTKVYATNGALVQTQVGGLNVNNLANGVYLAVTELRDALGKVHQQVRAVTVVR
ncbi:hypothetical protein HYR54_07960 [Candidatus Acetothermia bacterium]|nr:hypothetical protein [Candidatus Acetothermia bacterium]